MAKIKSKTKRKSLKAKIKPKLKKLKKTISKELKNVDWKAVGKTAAVVGVSLAVGGKFGPLLQTAATIINAASSNKV